MKQAGTTPTRHGLFAAQGWVANFGLVLWFSLAVLFGSIDRWTSENLLPSFAVLAFVFFGFATFRALSLLAHMAARIDALASQAENQPPSS